MAIVTPSAKSHERITGRWIRDYAVRNKREWTVYYFKTIVGSPVPLFMCLFACAAFLSRAGVEISAWACAILTALYIFADRFTSQREFQFFRVGYDALLIGYMVAGIASAFSASTSSDIVANLGGVRWALLLYMMTYCWELFPGLNRVFALVVLGAAAAGLYGFWQHFSGVDLIRGQALALAPVPNTVFFTPISFFNTTENFGTLMAMALPFPAATYLLDERRNSRPFVRYFSLGLTLFLAICVLWTYRPGMWATGIAAIFVPLILRARHWFKFLLTVCAMIGGLWLISYGSVDGVLDSIQSEQIVRAQRQRTQINTQFQLWQKNIWIGVGQEAVTAADYDPGTGNVYFQVLAQTGMLGAVSYLFFILGFLLFTYRIFMEIPESHYWHRVLIGGTLAGQICFHIAGLYWSTLNESLATNLFVLMLSATSYLAHHYAHGLVPDDHAL
jgi:hypothetical protein